MDKQLQNWRKTIDALDQNLLELLAKRMSIVEKIGKLKKEHGISVLDKKRWDKMLKCNLKKGNTLRLSKTFIKNLLTLIHEYSLKIQVK